MSEQLRPAEVWIDGTRYVPVVEGPLTFQQIRDAVVEQWAGEGWRESYPDCPSYLRVMVNDDGSEEGETVDQFAARIMSKLDPTAARP